MMIFGHGMSGWAMTLMGVGNLLFWGLLITGVILLIRRPGPAVPAPSPAAAPPTPQQLLAQRFARGEIDDAEYQHRLQVLTDSTGDRPGS